MAQLNSASDYGSEGYRFESCRGHIKINKMRVPSGTRFFMLNGAQAGAQALGSVKKGWAATAAAF